MFALTGDGELQEGQNWEAIMFAAHRKLDNLVVIVDNNNLQIDGFVTDVCDVSPVADKFEAFGWHAIECDGHDIPAIRPRRARGRRGLRGRPGGDRRQDGQGQGRLLHGEPRQLARQRSVRRAGGRRVRRDR